MRMPPPFRQLFRTFPAASRAVSLSLLASLATLLLAHLLDPSDRPRLFLLGDSCIGNYRQHPGQRIQDLLQRINGNYHVDNLAEPGAAPLDYLLQYFKGVRVLGRPERAVFTVTPDKFLPDGDTLRFNEDGVNLRWIPWNRSGQLLWQHMTPREQEIGMVQQVNVVLGGFVDGLRALWIRYIQWPWERYRMLTSDLTRRQRIFNRTVGVGKQLEGTPVGDSAMFSRFPKSRDAALALEILRREHIPTLVLILPYANPALVQRAFSPLALAKRDSSIVRMKEWLGHEGVTYLDLNAPQHLSQFPDERWDDHVHLKDPRAFAYMAEQINRWIDTTSSRTH